MGVAELIGDVWGMEDWFCSTSDGHTAASPSFPRSRTNGQGVQERKKSMRITEQKPRTLKITSPDGTVRTEVYRSHAAYMRSSWWRHRKARYWENHTRRCAACANRGSTKKPIHLHHKTYVRMGGELDEDLCGLCEGCHNRTHKLHKRGGLTLAQATDQIIQGGGVQPTRGVRKRTRTSRPAAPDGWLPRNQRLTAAQRVAEVDSPLAGIPVRTVRRGGAR